MNILLVHEVNYLSKIIYEFQILPEILSTLGHSVTVVDYDDTWESDASRPLFDLGSRVFPGVHRAYPDASITVVRPGMVRLPLVSRASASVTSGLEIRRLLSTKSFDAVLLYGLPTVGVQTLMSARKHRVPIFFRSIDVLYQLAPSPLLQIATRKIEGYVYRRVDEVFCVTPHLKQYVEAHGVNASRVRVLPSGVDGRMFSPGSRDHRLMAQWGVGPDDPVLLFMGTIYKFSGLDRVIQDLPGLLRSFPTARLCIVGVGEDEPRLKRLAQQIGVQKNVIFTGFQPYSLLPAILRSSDICINPFELNAITRDILPTKLFQYLACGKPVLATELPGTLPFLAGEEHGVVYASLDRFVPEASKLLSDPARRDALGKAGSEVSRREYDWTNIARKLVDWMSEGIR